MLLLLILLSVLPQLLLMLVEHAGWEPFQDPLVAQTLVRCHAFQWVPFQATANKVDKLRIWCLAQLFHNIFDPVILFLVADDLERGRHGRIIRFKLLE